MIKKNCIGCKKGFLVPPCRKKTAKYCSGLCVLNNKKGKNNPNWKEKVGYMRVHNWMRAEYGKASDCENKKCPRIYKRYEWALKFGKEYIKDRNNFIMLCKSCHRIYDKRIHLEKINI